MDSIFRCNMKPSLVFILRKMRCQSFRRNFKVCLPFILILCFIYGWLIYRDKYLHLYRHDSYDAPCEIPEVNPFDTEMMKYVWTPEPLDCHKNPNPVVYVDENNIVQFNSSVLSELNESSSSVTCEYYIVHRSQKENRVDKDVFFSDPVSFTPPADIQADFFRVVCRGKAGKMLLDRVIAKILKSQKTFGEVNPDKDIYNLMMFGIDSVSRAAAIRHLPNTFRYLTEELKAVDFKGYTKVRDNTYPNIIPLLTGFMPYSSETIQIDFQKDYMNVFPFIWKNFSSKGYATIFAEDHPSLGMFNTEKLGFNELPTDHYMRPFWLAKTNPVNHLLVQVQRKLQNQNLKIAPSALCYGNVPNHVTLTNYLKRFLLTYKKERKFLFSFLTEISHEYQNFLNLADTDFRDFFKWMRESGFLEDTIVIVFSDHGLKFGNNQHLFSARLESRLPWLNIILPEKLTKKYPKQFENFKINQNRLTSTFDSHATIRDILNSRFGNPSKYDVDNTVRGISLFQELPKDRSCKDANIGESYCACYKSEPVNVTNSLVIQTMAVKAVEYLNNLLRDSPECARLKLNTTISARKVSQSFELAYIQRRYRTGFDFHVPKAEERDDAKYILVLTTTPGGAKFFATCRYDKGHARVVGDIDRINKYGNQSHCIHDHRLKPFCFCNDMMENPLPENV